MNKKLMQDLMESIKEGGAILRGKVKPRRSVKFHDPDVRAIRAKLGLSQGSFSTMLGISPATLRNWEQNRRKPAGPARVLLRVAEKHPQAVLEAVHG